MPEMPGPQMLMEMHMSFIPARVLMTATELDLFTHVARGARTREAVAAATGASLRGISMLLEALAVLGLLTRDGEEFGLSPVARQYLVAGAEEDVRAMFTGSSLWTGWSQLTETVRSGRPTRAVEAQSHAEEFFPHLIQGLHVWNSEPARAAARALSARADGAEVRDVLDVGAGSGIWGIRFAEEHPGARVTAHDFPGLLDHTRRYVERHGLAERFSYLAGDLKDLDFGRERFDLAILGNIVHSEGEASNRSLFRRLHGALRPGGRIAIVDMIPSDDRSGPPFAIFFALNMLVHTQEGSTYTLGQYGDWLTGAGFSKVETADFGFHSPLILARK